jgi:outer membrane cobalamin receptor
MRLMRLIGMFLFFISTEANSQKGRIEGYIIDADSRSPLNGATVNIRGDQGDNSDNFGRFSIAYVDPGQYEMVVSHIGYKTEIIPIEVKSDLLSTINVHLRRSELDLAEVRLNSKKNTALNTLSGVDIRLRPVNNSQDVLRIVPGLFIAQHAGGGKAEQIFLRGYDIDHGTDISISVDGMPVNMVSHAHGQGYADLHFLIPETVEKVGFDKGPYFAGKGNLATAAYVEFSTKDFIEKNMLRLELGDFNSKRALAMLKLFHKQTEKNRQQFYIASEYSATDGYVESPQNFHRFNMMGKYNAWFGNQSQLSITLSGFDSKWDASGQIPDRAVNTGLITRFGSIDDSEGGNTSRINAGIRYSKQWKNNWKTTDHFYYIRYKFNLYSNFTFFLNDAANGDQINQRETRNIYGYNSIATKKWFFGNKKVTTEFGTGFRHDEINDNSLSHTMKRKFINSIQKGDVRETNAFLYLNQDLELTDHLHLNAGLRYDQFFFKYKDEHAGATGFDKQNKGILNPKLNISYSLSNKLKLFLNNGIGFHSNDTRVILSQNATEILPRVYGTDLGLIAKPSGKLLVKIVFWHLFSEQEFIYVGDEGIIEPSGKTRRIGLDLSARYQFNKWLFGDLDINLTRARAIGEAKGESYISLAPSFTSIGGLTIKTSGFSGAIRYRFIADRPGNEMNSVTATGYFISDLVVSHQWKAWELKLSLENIMNTSWKEAQFDTESRLQFETDPVSEIHFTPGPPRYFKVGIGFTF